MGKIVGLKNINEEKILINLQVSSKESLGLKGNLNNIHIFSENTLENISRLVQRGKRESTKYLLLPKSMRKNVSPSNHVRCSKIDTKTKYLFIFEVYK